MRVTLFAEDARMLEALLGTDEHLTVSVDDSGRATLSVYIWRRERLGEFTGKASSEGEPGRLVIESADGRVIYVGSHERPAVGN